MHVKNHCGNLLRPPRNPLVRVSDRVEALVTVILLAAGFAAIGIAVWLGEATADDVRASDSRWIATSYPVTAVVTDSGQGAARVVGDGVSAPWLTRVTWTGPDGVRRDGSMTVSHFLPPGAPLAVRIDTDGWPRAAQASDPGSAGIVIGVFVLLVCWATLLLMWIIVENLVLSHNLRRWEAEWCRAARQWS